MMLFQTKVKSEYMCPRCGAQMFAVSRPVNVVELHCETCDSVLSVDYVMGWRDGHEAAALAQVEVEG
jgi:transcription elongation factor Elf1